LNSPIVDLLNVKYVVDIKRDIKGKPDENGKSNIETRFDKYHKAFEDKTTVVLENMSVIPRAYLYSDWRVISSEDTLKGMLASDFDIRNLVYLDADPNIKKDPLMVGDYQYLIYKDNEQVIKVDSSSDAILFISDLNYPGWKASVNGIEEKIITADYCFKGIPVKKGTSYVKLLYKPKSFDTGIVISLLSFSLWIILLIYEIRLSKRGG